MKSWPSVAKMPRQNLVVCKHQSVFNQPNQRRHPANPTRSHAARLIPDGWADCISAEGDTTGYHIFQLNEDPNLRIAFMSTKQETVVADVFVGIGGAAFKAAMINEMAILAEAHSEGVRSLIADGNSNNLSSV